MSETQLTTPSQFDQHTDGYIVIAPLSDNAKLRIAEVQAKYLAAFGQKNLWVPSGDQLHVTFGHIVTPNVEYPEDKSALFSRVRPLATEALAKTVTHPFAITSTFDTVVAYPETVILKATDDGSFKRLRQDFIDNFSPPEGTRKPPEIIHTTLLRFRKPVDFGAVQKITEEVMADFEPFEELTNTLQLIHETKIFVQEHTVLEEFPAATA